MSQLVKIIEYNTIRKAYDGSISNLAILLDFLAGTEFERNFLPLEIKELKAIATEGAFRMRGALSITPVYLITEVAKEGVIKDSIDVLFCDSETKDCKSTFIKESGGKE